MCFTGCSSIGGSTEASKGQRDHARSKPRVGQSLSPRICVSGIRSVESLDETDSVFAVQLCLLVEVCLLRRGIPPVDAHPPRRLAPEASFVLRNFGAIMREGSWKYEDVIGGSTQAVMPIDGQARREPRGELNLQVLSLERSHAAHKIFSWLVIFEQNHDLRSFADVATTLRTEFLKRWQRKFSMLSSSVLYWIRRTQTMWLKLTRSGSSTLMSP